MSEDTKEPKAASPEFFPRDIRPPENQKEMLYKLMKALEIPTSRFEWVDRWTRGGSESDAEGMIPQVDESGKEEFIRAAAVAYASRSHHPWSEAESLWDQRVEKLKDARSNAVRNKAFEIYDKKYVEELKNLIILHLAVKYKIYPGL